MNTNNKGPKRNQRTSKPVNTNPTGDAANATEETTFQSAQDPIRILILGRSGSGKTYLVKDASGKSAGSMVTGLHKTTEEVEVTTTYLDGRWFELIDTPGFNNTGMSDVDVFVKIATYMLDSERIDEGISGIIYVHRASDTNYHQSTSQSLRVMANIFLGDVGMSRLTLLVTQLGAQDIEDKVFSDEMKGLNSAFSGAYLAGAELASKSGQAGLIETLRSYTSLAPVKLLAQLDGSHTSASGFKERVERSLALSDDRLKLLGAHEQQVQELTQELRDIEAKRKGLSIRLQLAQLNYSSLRSELGLQENTEQSQVIQTLQDLNRSIDDFGRHVSAYLIDTYARNTFRMDPSDVTVLHSRDLSGLKRLLGHQEGGASFIASSNGLGMEIEDFVDYSTRDLLCRYLVDKIFHPFHPQIGASRSKVLLDTYSNIQKREPQVVAGRWRAETFKNLYKSDGISKSEIVSRHLRNLVDCWFRPMAKYIFGVDAPLEETQHTIIRKLLETAWDWNSHLKENVVILGDFVQTCFLPSQFDSELMEEFESRSSDPKPEVILGTISLGLQCQRAVGQGSPVEKLTIRKAVVVTESIFN